MGKFEVHYTLRGSITVEAENETEAGQLPLNSDCISTQELFEGVELNIIDAGNDAIEIEDVCTIPEDSEVETKSSSGLQLHDPNWKVVVESEETIQYENYISGFPAVSKGDFSFDSVRVLISVTEDQEEEMEILIFPWKDGQTYTSPQLVGMIPLELREEIETLLRDIDFDWIYFERWLDNGVL